MKSGLAALTTYSSHIPNFNLDEHSSRSSKSTVGSDSLAIAEE
jgi:hypothetical protein